MNSNTCPPNPVLQPTRRGVRAFPVCPQSGLPDLLQLYPEHPFESILYKEKIMSRRKLFVMLLVPVVIALMVTASTVIA
jgi:hypothetical protein